MKKILYLVVTLAILGMTAVAYALFSNGGFEFGDFTGWTVEHGSARELSYHYELDNSTGTPVTVVIPDNENVTWQAGTFSDNDYYMSEPRAFVTGSTRQ